MACVSSSQTLKGVRRAQLVAYLEIRSASSVSQYSGGATRVFTNVRKRATHPCEVTLQEVVSLDVWAFDSWSAPLFNALHETNTPGFLTHRSYPSTALWPAASPVICTKLVSVWRCQITHFGCITAARSQHGPGRGAQQSIASVDGEGVFHS